MAKSVDELKELRAGGLSLAYFGIESGNNELLNKIDKGVNTAQMIEALHRVHETNIKISATVILGIGGLEYTREHISDTAELINTAPINYLSTLQLGLEEGAKERFLKAFDSFTPLNDLQTLHEQCEFLSLINPPQKIIFRSNHASNALHLSGTLPKDSAKLITQIDDALRVGQGAMVPRWMRGF